MMRSKSCSRSGLIGLACILLVACSITSTSKEEVDLSRVAELTSRIAPEQAVALAVNEIRRTDDGFVLDHQRHRAAFRADGLSFSPRKGNLSWKWTFAYAGPEGEAEQLRGEAETVMPMKSGPGVMDYVRGNLIERYVVRTNSLEQQFVLPVPLHLQGSDLLIAGKISSAGTFEETKQGWLWRSDDAVVSLGKVHVFDAAGRDIPAQLIVARDSTRIVVDGPMLARATYPVTVDPEIGTNDFRISDMGPNGSTAYDAFDPAVAYNSTNNEYLVVWDGDDNSGDLVNEKREIFGQRINGATGEEIGDDFRISSTGNDGNDLYDAQDPSVAYNSTDNEFLVVWEGDPAQDGLVNNEFEIFGQRLDGVSGAELAGDFRISDMGDDGDDTYDAEDPDVSYNRTNNQYLVVWKGDDNTGALADDEFEIFGQRINAASGAEVGDDFRISSVGDDGETVHVAQAPAVAYNSTDNEYLVVWDGNDGSNGLSDEEFEIHGQRIDAANGTEVGDDDFRISSMGDDGEALLDAFNPAVAYNSTNNEYLVVWEGDTDSGSLVDQEFEIWGQRLNARTGAEIESDFRISDMGGADGDADFGALSAKVAYDSTNNEYLVVWSGEDDAGSLVNDEHEIYGQRIDASNGDQIGDNDFRLSDMGSADGSTDYNAWDTGVAYNSINDAWLIVWEGDDDTPPLVNGEREIFGQRYTAYPQQDTDDDGNPDVTDDDDDDDGLTDDEEDDLGSDPLDSDTDDDGVDDGQEEDDGTNPLDPGSNLPVLPATVCSEWNGFLGGMWNIAEHVNMSSSDLNIEATLYDINGDEQSVESFRVTPGTQQDLLVHDMDGWTLDSYGKVCSSVENGGSGDFDGRMVYYKEAPNSVPPDYQFEFAFAMPFLNGITGTQFVPFNTFQPSLDPADSANPVANWIQLTNLEDTLQTGNLIFHAQDGSELGTQDVSLPGGARQDYSGHQFGTDLVGIVEWQPDDASARFQLRNVRYAYDNPLGEDTFTTAFQLEGMVGSGELLAVPLDTTSGSAILEIANATASDRSVTVVVYDANGVLQERREFVLEGYASEHMITDSILNGAQGLATIDGTGTSSVIAVAMQYERTATAGIRHLYGIAARQALGTTLRGSYNTFLGQDCRLIIGNPTGSDVLTTVSMRRYDGTDVLTGEELTVPAHGMLDYDLCVNDEADNYGVVTVQPAVENTVVSQVIRIGNNNSYRFPTPVRQ